MLRFIILIALFLPSFAIVQGKQKKNGNFTACSDPEAIKAGDEFFSCFDIEVTNNIEHENRTCTTWLPAVILEFVKVANKTCYNDTISRGRDAVEFYKFMKFSMNNYDFEDFVENGGFECIKGIKEKIKHCVSNVLGHAQKSHNKYYTLWKKTNLTIDVMSCQETDRLKTCVVNVIRSDYKCKYENSNELYVSSLFDYMLDRCSTLKPEWENNQYAKKEKFEQRLKDSVHITHVLLGILLTLALLGFLYTLIRDCRTPSGRWKSFNEHFAMRQRRRSLVNNEVCHEN